MEAGVAQVKSHRAEGVRKRIGFRHQDLRAGSFLPGDNHRSGAISEKNGRNQVGLGNVFALKGKRGKLDGDN